VPQPGDGSTLSQVPELILEFYIHFGGDEAVPRDVVIIKLFTAVRVQI
jgi:hypothetical protein